MRKSKTTDEDRARILLADGDVIAMDISSEGALYIVECYGLRYVIRQTAKKTIITTVGNAHGKET